MRIFLGPVGSTLLALFLLPALNSPICAQSELSAPQIARKALPSVVLVVCANSDSDDISQGSGFFIEPGVVVTNYHVIEGMNRGLVQVALGERKEKKNFRIARIIGFDKDADLALLSVPSAVEVTIPSLSLVRQDYRTEVGETVFALGNPEGLVGSMTQGMVSASVRSTLKKARIQISAPISHGSSGGPVVNRFGQVIGVAVGSLSEGQNLNFAVPASLIYGLYLTSDFPSGTLNATDMRAESDSSRPRLWELGVPTGSGYRRSYTDAINGINNEEAGDPKTAGEYFDRGIRRVNEKRYKEAISDFTKSISLDPQMSGSYINRGLVYGRQGKILLEIADYTKAIKINPKAAIAYLNRGAAYGKQKKTALELSDYTKAIELNPKLTLAFYYRGEIYFQQEKYALALKDLNVVIRQDPRNFMAYIRRGISYQSLKQTSNAISDYSTAINIDPASWIGYFNRGAVLMNIKDYAAAIDDLSNAILINPKHAASYSYRSYCYCMIGENSLSLKDFKLAIELGAVAALQCSK